jgi:hypothetical protein
MNGCHLVTMFNRESRAGEWLVDEAGRLRLARGRQNCWEAPHPLRQRPRLVD